MRKILLLLSMVTAIVSFAVPLTPLEVLDAGIGKDRWLYVFPMENHGKIKRTSVESVKQQTLRTIFTS